ncbi:hypothetical protein AMJ52_09360 [candidate division TA06 bacterium DG_78]|uniref:SPOR domain-containing protein n=1 Tax=candidate division TA06 bacterium DG_78 TaxID=1703772 RepID=A0A0S7Y7Y5_UNCT6|nr:MAG: hypothetical protein AMJ52_09360 [candidate division TA06 bacterium DG_78]
MKKILLIGCIIFFVLCAPKKTTVETEGLEEVIVFGEEEGYVIEEPVYPEEEVTEPEEIAVVPPPIEEEPMPVIEEPVSVIEEPSVPPPVEEAPPPVIEEPYVPPAPPPALTPSPLRVFGFRIQIFASSTEKNANRVASDASSVLTERVYVDYVAPYYKVRVGDCLTYEDAETLKNRMLRQGYHGAFIVETMVTP